MKVVGSSLQYMAAHVRHGSFEMATRRGTSASTCKFKEPVFSGLEADDRCRKQIGGYLGTDRVACAEALEAIRLHYSPLLVSPARGALARQDGLRRSASWRLMHVDKLRIYTHNMMSQNVEDTPTSTACDRWG